MRRLKALELFGCAGGMGLGFLRAGIHFDAVLERDPDHAQSYAHNVGHKPIEMDVHAFLPVGHYDLIVADPPCTPWSISGNRRVHRAMVRGKRVAKCANSNPLKTTVLGRSAAFF